MENNKRKQYLHTGSPKVKQMKTKEDRLQELTEQVQMLIEVSESEARLAKLFPQSRFNIGSGEAKEVEGLKKKNIGKKGKFHSVIKMKRSSVIMKPEEPQEAEAQEVVPGTEETLNNPSMTPEDTIRGMQDPMRVAQDLLAQGMQPEEVIAQMVQQGMDEQQVVEIVQQLVQGSPEQQQ